MSERKRRTKDTSYIRKQLEWVHYKNCTEKRYPSTQVSRLVSSPPAIETDVNNEWLWGIPKVHDRFMSNEILGKESKIWTQAEIRLLGFLQNILLKSNRLDRTEKIIYHVKFLVLFFFLETLTTDCSDHIYSLNFL